MQRYKIIHQTYYNYRSDILLGEHKLLLRPREDHELRIESFNLSINPDAKILWHRDVEDNSVALASFTSLTKQLRIQSEVIIQQYNESPLNFLVADYALSYPFEYENYDNNVLAAYRALPEPAVVTELNTWISSFWQRGENIQTYSLLQRLAEHIYTNFEYRVREEPGVQDALYTLSCNNGSCRDFALLFIETSRCLGLASRFVSGYLYAGLGSDIVGATHAWAEVYIPGAGWKGFDPTIGKIVGSDHIAVAVAQRANSIPPVSGSFIGADDSELDVGVWVSKY